MQRDGMKFLNIWISKYSNSLISKNGQTSEFINFQILAKYSNFVGRQTLAKALDRPFRIQWSLLIHRKSLEGRSKIRISTVCHLYSYQATAKEGEILRRGGVGGDGDEATDIICTERWNPWPHGVPLTAALSIRSRRIARDSNLTA